MNRESNTKEKPNRVSFYNDFLEEELTSDELFNSLGGIETETEVNNNLDGIVPDDISDSVGRNWKYEANDVAAHFRKTLIPYPSFYAIRSFLSGIYHKL